MSSLWSDCIDLLSRELPEQLVNTWLRPLNVDVDLDAGLVTLGVANRFKLDWIRAQYLQRIKETLQQLCQQEVRVELVLSTRSATSKKTAAAAQTSPNPAQGANASADQRLADAPTAPPAPQEATSPMRRNPP